MRRVLVFLVAAALVAGVGVVSASAVGKPVPVAVVVDDDGFGTAASCDDGATPAFTTIGFGVTAAAPGQTVQVCPGTYVGGVFVLNGVSVKGVGSPAPVVGCGNPSLSYSPFGFAVVGASVGQTIEGIDFEAVAPCDTGGVGVLLSQSSGSSSRTTS